ncbi:hypothetical protein SEVIR_1G209050v4 [Setaria viridis]
MESVTDSVSVSGQGAVRTQRRTGRAGFVFPSGPPRPLLSWPSWVPPTRPPWPHCLPTRRRGERSPKAAGLPLDRLLLDARPPLLCSSSPHRRSALAFHGSAFIDGLEM